MVGFAEAFTGGLNAGSNATRGLVTAMIARNRSRDRDRALDLAEKRDQREEGMFYLQMEQADRAAMEWDNTKPLRDAEQLTRLAELDARSASARTSVLASEFANSMLDSLLGGGGGAEDPGQPASDGRTVKAPMPPAAPRASTPSCPCLRAPWAL